MNADNFQECVGGICLSARICPFSVIVLIGSVLPNWCLGVTLFYYFRFLFVTRENYSGKSQRKLAYQDLILARVQRQYAITPLRHCTITPLRHYASMPVRQYASTPVRQLYKPQQYSLELS